MNGGLQASSSKLDPDRLRLFPVFLSESHGGCFTAAELDVLQESRKKLLVVSELECYWQRQFTGSRKKQFHALYQASEFTLCLFLV